MSAAPKARMHRRGAPRGVKFRRVVFGVPLAEARSEAAEAAARFAQALGLDLAGLFVEDETLLAMADLPFTAEIAVGGTTRRFERAAVERSFQAAASLARGQLAAAAAAARIAYTFEALRGTVREAATRTLRAGDVVALTEPEDAVARACHNTASMLEAALGGPAAVLMMPGRRPARRQAGVAAYVEAGGAAAVLEAAISIASALGSELTVLVRRGRAPAAAEIEALARKVHLAAPLSVATLEGAVDALLAEADAPELANQLLVLSREVARELGVAALRRASQRRPAPILVL